MAGIDQQRNDVAEARALPADQTIAIHLDESAILRALPPSAFDRLLLDPGAALWEAARAKTQQLLHSLDLDVHKGFGGGDTSLVFAVLPHDRKVLARGSTALVLSLGAIESEGTARPMIAKFVGYSPDPRHPHLYCLDGTPAGGVPGAVRETVNALHTLGFTNVVPHQEFSSRERLVRVNGKEALFYPECFHLCPDLRGDGSFTIHEAADFEFSSILNGPALQAEFVRTVAAVEEAIEGGHVAFTISNKHGIGTNREAIARMLFVVVETAELRGRLVFGDLDHCRLEQMS